MNRMRALFAIGLFASACGGARTELRAESPLGPRVEIPGTGVTLEPPARARMLPLGPGVMVPESDVVITIAVRNGEPSLRAELVAAIERAGGERISIDRRAATLVRDALPGADGSVARLTLVVDAGSRILVATATCTPTLGEERVVRASLATIAWNIDAVLDPEAAIGLDVDPGPDLAVDRGTVSLLALTRPGETVPLAPGAPMLTLLPLARPPPARGDLDACEALIAGTGVLTSEPAPTQAIESTSMHGCETTGVVEREEGDQVFAYVAVVVIDVGPFLAVGTVAEEGSEGWGARFSAVALSLRHNR